MARMYSVMAAGQGGGGGGGSVADLAGASVFWVREGESVGAQRNNSFLFII
jgi:hypothetical protein